MQKIPLTEGAQTFSIDLGENTLTVTLLFRNAKVGSAWYLDLETSGGEISLKGVPIVCGIDLLEQHQYLGLGKLFAKVNGSTSATPTYENMGAELELFWEE